MADGADRYAGFVLPTSIEQKLAPKHSALVVVDMQNDFVDPHGYFGGSRALQALVTPIQRLIAGARRVGVGVHFVRIEQAHDLSTASAVWISEALRKGYEPRQCIAGTWGAAIVDQLTPRPGDRVHLKHRRSAFRGTRLADELRSAEVQTVIVTGLAATGCVEYTVRAALDRDFHPVVPLDAIADATDEPGHSWAAHYAAILPARNLLTTDELLEIWTRR